jgi:hypothetical protein
LSFAWLYLAGALGIGGLFFWRNRSPEAIDAEFVFLCAGVAVLWPVAVVLDLYGWWESRR